MAGIPSNDLNISQAGYVVFDGVSTFTGRTFLAGTGITITNGSGIAGNTTISSSGSSSGIVTITGGSGGALSPTAGNINIVGTGGISTSGTGSTLTISNSNNTGAGFSIYLTADIPNALGGGGRYDISFDGILYDSPNSYAGTYYVVPYTGNMILSLTTCYSNLSAANTSNNVIIYNSTQNLSYGMNYNNPYIMQTSLGNAWLGGNSMLVPVTAGDHLYFSIFMTNTGQTVTLSGGQYYTRAHGFYI